MICFGGNASQVLEWTKRGKGQREKIKCLCKTVIVYFKCKGYSFEVNIVLSVKPKPKLHEWKESKNFESQWIFKIPVESLIGCLSSHK